jgi:arylsulfatase A-like enzyme
LLVLSHYAVHTPLESKPDLEAKYAARVEPPEGPEFEDEHGYGTTKVRQDNPTYAGMLESTDDSLRRVMTALAEADLAESTIVVFVSDNGGLSTLAGRPERAPTSNKPLRAGKGWLYEGGIRIPMILRWPNGASAGMRSDVAATTADVLPTLLDLAGLAAPTDAQFDGVSLAPALAGEPFAERSLFWHFPHYHGSGNRPSGAVRRGRFKLLEWFESGAVELYDLDADLGEVEDLAAAMPDQVAELRDLLHQWREDVGAAMPTPNPDWSGGK